jgi:hypothetical protein
MAINIKGLSPGDIVPNAVFSPHDTVWPKFCHHVKKFFYHVMLKITSIKNPH